MKPSHPVKRPAAGAPGVKALITAASLALTVGGWAALARTQPTPEEAAPGIPVPTAGITIQQPAASFSLDMPALPTLAPLPSVPEIAVARPPDISADLLAAPAAQVVQPAVPAAPAAAQPLPAVSAPALRVVSVPRPVARTRSSR